MNKKQSGFTLIELLVVVAIIGILAAIALPKLFSAICTAKEGTAQGVIGSLNTAISVYYGRNEGNFMVGTANDVDPTSSTSGIGAGSTGYDFIQYFATNPEDPWVKGQDYRYAGDAADYSLSIKANGGSGCDGSAATTDDCIFYNNNLGKITRYVAATCL